MIEIQANPGVETLKLALYFAISIIGVCVLIIGYFIRIRSNGEKERMDKLSEVVETIKTTVSNLDKIVEIIRKRQEDTDPRTERRLNEHARILDTHDRQIATIETKCNIHHKTK